MGQPAKNNVFVAEFNARKLRFKITIEPLVIQPKSPCKKLRLRSNRSARSYEDTVRWTNTVFSRFQPRSDVWSCGLDVQFIRWDPRDDDVSAQFHRRNARYDVALTPLLALSSLYVLATSSNFMPAWQENHIKSADTEHQYLRHSHGSSRNTESFVRKIPICRNFTSHKNRAEITFSFSIASITLPCFSHRICRTFKKIRI